MRSVVMVKMEPACEHAAAVFEAAKPDLGPLQIQQDADVRSGFAGGRAHRVDAGRVFVLRAVRRIEPENIHAGVDQLAEDTGGVDGRTQGGYDFGVLHPADNYLARLGGVFAFFGGSSGSSSCNATMPFGVSTAGNARSAATRAARGGSGERGFTVPSSGGCTRSM